MSKLVEIKTNTNESIKVASIKADIISKIIEIAPMCDKIDYIYLFGSSLEERCTDRSDIDLAIVSNVTRSRLYSNQSYRKFLHSIYDISIEQDYDFLQFNSLSKLQNSKDYVCNEILTKGKVIYTRKETVKCMKNTYQNH